VSRDRERNEKLETSCQHAAPVAPGPALRRSLLGVILLFSSSACALFPPAPARQAPPLRDMEEPLALAKEPDDEAQRAKLALGSFTGIVAGDARQSLEDMLSEPSGVLVASVVENSPADVAGIAEGDLLLSAKVGDKEQTLKWPSDWRAIELATPPGTTILVRIDRAAAERSARIACVPRVHAPDRDKSSKLREEQRVGVVLRGATEVEARAAGLGPGGGAVVIGLSRSSPWRKDGVVFDDLIESVDGTAVAHPEVVLEAIRAAPKDGELSLGIVRAGEKRKIEAHVSRRESETKHITIPIVFDYEKDRGESDTSFLLGFLRYQATEAAWQFRFLWIFSFSGGDADRLKVEGS
jgi:hypothetical protein